MSNKKPNSEGPWAVPIAEFLDAVEPEQPTESSGCDCGERDCYGECCNTTDTAPICSHLSGKVSESCSVCQSTTTPTCHPNATTPDDCPRCGARYVFDTTTKRAPAECRHGHWAKTCAFCDEVKAERARIVGEARSLPSAGPDEMVRLADVLAVIRGGDDA